MTRFDLSLDESGSESAWQNAVQWGIYFAMQFLIATANVKEDPNFTFHALWVSGVMSTVSLTLGQIKVC